MDALPAVVLAVPLFGAATWLWTSPGDPARRLHRAGPHLPVMTGSPAGSHGAATGELPRGDAGAGPAGGAGRERLGRGEAATAVVTGLLIFLAAGGVAGVVAGLAGSLAVPLILRRREPAALRRERDRVTADLPLAADLMVACLRAGQPITGALDVTVLAIGGPLGDRLAWVSRQLRLGADPESAWSALAGERSLAPLARTMSRAALSGAPVADVLARVSDDSRHAARAMSAAAARRVGVQAVAPLGLCFLPAFVLLGIVPVVAGLAGEVLIP
jgi:Flp pilus assembly protein TadB